MILVRSYECLTPLQTAGEIAVFGGSAHVSILIGKFVIRPVSINSARTSVRFRLTKKYYECYQ